MADPKVLKKLLGSLKKDVEILMIGPKGAGKTAIFDTICKSIGNRHTQIVDGIQVDCAFNRRIKFRVWDISGPAEISIMREHFSKSEAVIFVVDSNDQDGLLEAKNALHMVLREDVLRDAVLVVCANKIDLPSALGVEKIIDQLDLNSIEERTWHINGTCGINGDGIAKSMELLINTIDSKIPPTKQLKERRCNLCKQDLITHWNAFVNLLESGFTEEDAFVELGVDNHCCKCCLRGTYNHLLNDKVTQDQGVPSKVTPPKQRNIKVYLAR